MEDRELEVERRTRAINLNAVRNAETRSAVPSVRSKRTHTTREQGLVKPHHEDPFPSKRVSPLGIKVSSTVTTKTVKQPPASPRREQDKTGQAQDLKAMM